jgi:hypothetical protein
VGNSPIEFADSCRKLYLDATLWASIRTAALEWLSSECSAEMFRESVQRILGEIPRRDLLLERRANRPHSPQHL